MKSRLEELAQLSHKVVQEKTQAVVTSESFLLCNTASLMMLLQSERFTAKEKLLWERCLL